jgi:DNA-binding transcriptional MerR regulator
MRKRKSQYMTASEVARMLEISRQTLYNWLKSGKIPQPSRHPSTGYPMWKPEDVDRIRIILSGATL